jgi:hypothetical protein
MNSVPISIVAETEVRVEERARAAGFASATAYPAHRVQREQDVEPFRAILLAAVPVPVSEFDAAFFGDLERSPARPG